MDREFVARENELARFRENLGLPVDSPDRRKVFSVYGIGGVGKSSLLKQYRRIAEKAGAVIGFADMPVADAAEAMHLLTADPDFQKAYARYRNIQSPDAGETVGSFVTKSAVRATAKLTGADVFVDSGSLADETDRLRRGMVARLKHESTELGRTFVNSLAKVAKKKSMVLIIDTYEQAGPDIDRWLRDLEPPAEVVLVIAGRSRLSDGWSGRLHEIEFVPLDPFTETEADLLLAAWGITDDEIAAAIRTSSRCLPLYVASFAAQQPADVAAVPEASGGTVARILQWDDPDGWDDIVAAAYPRLINEDVLRVLMGKKAAKVYRRLRDQPYISESSDGLRFHELVRTQMLRWDRNRSPSRWHERHQELADASDVLSGIELDYHALCSDPQELRPVMFTATIQACERDTTDLPQWLRMVSQAGDDSGDTVLADWGRTLTAALGEADLKGVIAVLDELLQHAELPERDRALAFRTRGMNLWLLDRHSEALQDLERALAFDADDPAAVAYRGEVKRSLGQLEAAMDDLNHAIELDDSDWWSIESRASANHDLERIDAALADFERALPHRAGNAWFRRHRGWMYVSMERMDLARADFAQAVVIDGNEAYEMTDLGRACVNAGRFSEALEIFEHFSPEDTANLSSWGKALRYLGRFDEALVKVDSALASDPGNVWALSLRAEIHWRVGALDKALADIERLGLDDSWDCYVLGCVLWHMGDRGGSRQYLSRAADLAERDDAANRFRTTSRFNLSVMRTALGAADQAYDILRSAFSLPYPIGSARLALVDFADLGTVPGVDLVQIHTLSALIRAELDARGATYYSPPLPALPANR